MKKGRSCYSPAQWCLYALGSLAVPLRCLFDRWSRPLQVLRCHHRMDLYGRVQSEEKRFRHSGDLGGVVHVNNKVSTPCTFHVREVRCLRIDLFNDRSNSLIEGPVPGQFVSRICREAEREHEAHTLLLPTRLKETSGRLSLLYPPVTGSPQAWACSSGEGTAPICCIRPRASQFSHSSTILPSSMRWIVIPVIPTSLPVGAMPISSPWCVSCALQRLTTLSPSAISSSSVMRRSGRAERIMETNCFKPSIPRTSSSGSCITMVCAYTSWRASSRVSRLPVPTISQERRVRALFSSDIYCPPFSRFRRWVVARQLYSGPKRSPAHELNVLFLPNSKTLRKIPGKRGGPALFTLLPRREILGNWASGFWSSWKPVCSRSDAFRLWAFSETQKESE